MIERFVIPESKLFHKLVLYKLNNVIPIIDYAVENSKQTQAFETNFKRMLETYPNNVFALKLSGLNLDESATNRLIEEARVHDSKILIDAENVNIQHKIEAITNRIISHSKNKHVFKTYQMYRNDSYTTLANDIETYNTNLNVKLVRGAYMHTDRFSGRLYTNKSDTDNAYNDAIALLLQNQHRIGQVIFATHNKQSFELIKHTTNDNFYHASLMGFDDNFHSCNIQRMVYVPFGPPYQTYPYLIRRFLENPIAFV